VGQFFNSPNAAGVLQQVAVKNFETAALDAFVLRQR